jgi:hypothetical protein
MLGANVLQDLDISSLVETFSPYTDAGRAALTKRLSEPLTDGDTLRVRRNELRGMRDKCKGSESAIHELRISLRDSEADVRSVANASEDKRHAEYYAQILWAPDSRFSWLNPIGWLNELIIFLRTIFLPGVSVIMPILVLAAPLVFFLVMKEPVTMEGYFQMLHDSVKKAMPSVLGKARFAGTGGVLEMGEQLTRIGAGIAMFAASIWNQISAAINMRAVVDDIRRRARSVMTFMSASVDLGAILGLSVHPIQDQYQDQDPLGLFGYAWNNPQSIRKLLETGGQMDMLASLALKRRICFPDTSSDTSPILRLTDLYHPTIQPSKRIHNSLTLDKKSHVILTGPNRGGKSTLLKSLGCAVLMAQTVGFVFARSATMPIFTTIITALSPQDVVGKMSLFEAEIEFAKDVKTRLTTSSGPTFLMMDEIFHGTNAHDGVEASQVFLDDLYATAKPIVSVVSTHYMDLPSRYGSRATQNMCMDASRDPTDPDRLVYTYRLKDGVNEYSSVREILQERGLLARVNTVEKTS